MLGALGSVLCAK